MEIAFTKTFSKQIDNIQDESLKFCLTLIVQNVILANILQDIAS